MTLSQWSSYRDQGTLFSFSGRTTHAYSLDGDLDATQDLLRSITDTNHSLIIDRQTALELAGGNDEFGSRIGDFNIISADDYMFHVPNSIAQEEEQLKPGHHGSLTTRELFVPVAILSNQYD